MVPSALIATAATTWAAQSIPATTAAAALHAPPAHSWQIPAAGCVETRAVRGVAQPLPQWTALSSLAVVRIAESLPNWALHVVPTAACVVRI